MAVVGRGGGCGWQRNLIVPSGGPCQGDIALQFPFLKGWLASAKLKKIKREFSNLGATLLQ